jgi:hypothetical protein
MLVSIVGWRGQLEMRSTAVGRAEFDHLRSLQTLLSTNAGMACNSQDCRVNWWGTIIRASRKLCHRMWTVADTLLFAIVLLGTLSGRAVAQTPQPMPPGPPQDPARPLLTPVDQADENFSFLRDPSKRTDLWDPLKYIPLNERGDVYLTFGFETRSEYEWFQNANWGGGPQTISGY